MNADELIALLEAGRGVFIDGEATDELEHALQCATWALADGADDELIVAAALHDIGYHPRVSAEFPGLPHEEAGARFTTRTCGERVGWLIAQHVPAKRYLVATDRRYAATLSDASTRSLAVQGGAMEADEVATFEMHPWSADAARLRRWDDLSKVVGAGSVSVHELRPIFARVLARVALLDQTAGR